MSVTAVGLTAGTPVTTPSVPASGHSFTGSFAAVLASELPQLPSLHFEEFDWLRYRQAVFASDEAASRKRLAALRKRDPALAARLERIFRLPLWDQPGALAEIRMAHQRQAMAAHPDRPQLAAFFAQRAAVARSISLRSVFDQADIGR